MDFQKLVDLNTLIPLLCKNRVLGCDDLRNLHKLYQESRTVRVGELVAILETKGKEGIHKLIESLNEDEEHIGHWELSRILADKYSKSVIHTCMPCSIQNDSKSSRDHVGVCSRDHVHVPCFAKLQ